jgi:propionyl-CoA carboxylase alpha chain
VPIRRLLVANRSEIARRVMRTARAMGITTIAVYSEGDAAAPFVTEADEAIALGGRTAAESYLDPARIIAACERAGADAVHPGYGFLSENADFAEAVIAKGMTWVGPSPAAIRAIGDKLAAKRLLKPLGIPLLEAFELTPSADAQAAAQAIGYPVLIKAAAGGGGRGMRVVEHPADLPEAIESARREAAASFGDGTVFLERWLTKSRHVEIQILGDRHGQIVHLFERECSIQRRHQKIIEEAPSPALDADLRRRMCEAAVAAARAIDYHSVGTVEFLVSGQDFFFLEVNTRLQVEHPVTEAITGLDLVREQIRVAEGEPLGYGQHDLAIDGHAIEARLCAEDPAKGFLPMPGTVLVWEPPQGSDVRFDSGVEAGTVIGTEFDPMIAKVVAWAPTRREAAAKLAHALEQTRIHGVVHNRDFLVATLRTPEFLAGDTTTDFIERVQPACHRAVGDQALHAAAIAAALHARHRRGAARKVQVTIPAGFRNSVMPPETVTYGFGERRLVLTYRCERGGGFTIHVDDEVHHVVQRDGSADQIRLEIDGRLHIAVITVAGDRRYVHGAAGDIDFVELSRFPATSGADASGGLTAPMPGMVLSILAGAGDTVAQGQLLLILEAMKMEHRICAPRSGTIRALHIAAGEQVANGALLLELEDEES